MAELTKLAFQFLEDLYANNRKEWFDDNRVRYEQHVREPMKTIAKELSGPVSLILPDFEGKPKLSRINNDIRFSPNKPLYKEHVWISFTKPSENFSADLFVAISRRGWSAGAGIGSPKRDQLEYWRENLIRHNELWTRYANTIGIGDSVGVFAENPYRRPLYESIPQNVYELVQARSTWIVSTPELTIPEDPARGFFNRMMLMLPAYLFMSVTPDELPDRLAETRERLDDSWTEIQQVWNLF